MTAPDRPNAPEEPDAPHAPEIPDLAAIRERLIRAGYPRPTGEPTASPVRGASREAQEARADLRAHIIDDVWALIDALEARTAGADETR